MHNKISSVPNPVVSRLRSDYLCSRQEKTLRKNAVATTSNSALRNLFPRTNKRIKTIQNEKKLLSTASAHGHARPPNAKPVRQGRPQRNRNLLDHHRKTILTAPTPRHQLKYLRFFHEQKVVDYLHRENHPQLPTFRSRRGRILQSRRTESAEKEGEKNSKK